jgi:cell wall-associated NlpC family hydrolase
VVAAQRTLAESVSDLAVATRMRNRAEFEASGAQGQLSVAVRDMYIQGTTDVDVLMGVLGSKPDDVLRTIDSVMYMRSATGDEANAFVQAQDSAVAAQSAAAATGIRADRARKNASDADDELTKEKKALAAAEAELARLVSVAQPQTVVGPGGCPTAVLAGTVPDGTSVKKLCEAAVRNAASPQAAFAIKWALVRLGAPYACEGIGRLAAWRYDCSSYVSRAYAEGAGLGTAGDGWAPSTRNMVPWDGASLDPHYAVIPPGEIRPGDLVLYDTCPAGQTCAYRHVVMYLGPQEKGGVPMMAHTNACGSVAHVQPFIGTDVPNFLGVRRVVPLAGEKVKIGANALDRPDEAKKPGGNGGVGD